MGLTYIEKKGIPITIYQFTVVIEPDEDAFHAYVSTLLGCHTFGATVEEAQANITEATTLHVESMIENGEFTPLIFQLRPKC